ncbi:MAG: hypothetical protein KDA65_12295 [Planctomycetaceae bacterium]|nr:hypothetical protein [Planctomycetaceae bacterium]
MNDQTPGSFPRALKLIGVLLACAFCFTMGRFASVWETRISNKTKMEMIIADTNQFEGEMNEILETIRSDIETLVEESGEFIPESSRRSIEHGLDTKVLWSNSRRPFKNSRDKARTLSHLESLTSHYFPATLPRFNFVYDKKRVESLPEEGTDLDETRQRITNLYQGKSFHLEELLPSLAPKLTNSQGYSTNQITNHVIKSPEYTSFQATWFLRSNSEVYPEGAILVLEGKNDLKEDLITLEIKFQEFALGK